MAADLQPRTPNSFLVVIASAGVFIIVVAVLIGSLAATRGTGDGIEAKRAAQRVETHAKLEKEAMERLAAVGWVDKAKGIVHVPIETAMAQTARDLSAKKAAPSAVKVEPLPPSPASDPKSTEPPPAALPSAPQGADMVQFFPPVAAPAVEPAPAATPPAAKSAAPVPVPPSAPAAPAPPPSTPAPAKSEPPIIPNEIPEPM